MKRIRTIIAALTLGFVFSSLECAAGFQAIGETYWTSSGNNQTLVSVPSTCTVYSRASAEANWIYTPPDKGCGCFHWGNVNAIIIVAGPVTGLVHQINLVAHDFGPTYQELFAFNQPAQLYAVYHIVQIGGAAYGGGSARTYTTLSW